MVKLTVKSIKEILVANNIKYETAEEFFKDLGLVTLS